MLTNNISGGKNRITKNAALLLKSRAALFEASWLTYHKGTALVPGGPGWPGKAEDIADFNIDTEIAFFLKEAKAAAKEVIGNAALVQNTAKDCMDEKLKQTKTNINEQPLFCSVLSEQPGRIFRNIIVACV